MWIEIGIMHTIWVVSLRRGSREPCGLKFVPEYLKVSKTSRGSREPCGLKLVVEIERLARGESRLARALWIEMPVHKMSRHRHLVEARESLVD